MTEDVVQLRDDDAEQYCEVVAKAIRGAKLSHAFPDAKSTANHIRLMAPSVHRGLYDGIELNRESGLPTYRMWARVQADIAASKTELPRLGAREAWAAKAERGDIYKKQLAKFDYYSTIVDQRSASIGDVSVSVRKIDDTHGSYHVVLDKLDVSGAFIRYAIDLTQTHDSEMIEVRQEALLGAQTSALHGLVYKFAALNSTFTFAKLSSIPGIHTESVQKGTIGPIYFPWSAKIPAALRPLVEDQGWVATFSIDHAARDILTSKWNDPIVAERDFSEISNELGFRVFRDRKFVVSRERRRDLEQALKTTGFKNIQYAVR